jgi:hypothetical protein
MCGNLGWRVSQNTIAAIMAEQGLKARTLRRRSGCWMPPSGGFTLQRVAPGEDGPLFEVRQTPRLPRE